MGSKLCFSVAEIWQFRFQSPIVQDLVPQAKKGGASYAPFSAFRCEILRLVFFFVFDLRPVEMSVHTA